MPRYVPLADRTVVRVAGEDARPFLQNIVTNDVEPVSPSRAIYAALLTPQGKYLHDFFIAEWHGAIALETGAARIDDLIRRLRLYKLRAKVEIAIPDDAPEVFALIGDGALASAGLSDEPGACRAFAGGIAFTDPRLAEIGARAILPAGSAAALEAAGFAHAEPADYDTARIALGLPEGGRELRPEQSFLLENGFEELHGVDFDKGCYVGQEVTARMKHRNLVRKRLVPVTIDGPAPEPGTAIRRGDAEAGEVVTVCGASGLAMLKLDQMGEGLVAGEAKVVPTKPSWARF